MSEPIATQEEALIVAQQFAARGEERARLVKQLEDEDMLGLECSETAQLERLTVRDVIDGERLAQWIVADAADVETDGTHCDDYVDNPRGNSQARWFIFIHRLPAILQILAAEHGCAPRLFADYRGERVRVTMASRLGDVGITSNLDAEYVYTDRVKVGDLSNFAKTP